MTSIRLSPIAALQGDVHLPGSKSISNRALLLASLADGTTRIQNLLKGDDSRFMLDALRTLGVDIAQDAVDYVVTGRAGPLVTRDQVHDLYLGLAGTAIRPLTAALTLGGGTFRLSGEPRMQERPIGHLVDALKPLGGRIDYEAEDGYPPLIVHGTGLAGGATSIDGSVSSQFLTSLLLAAPLAREAVRINVLGDLVSRPYIDITLNLMTRFGVDVSNDAYRHFEVPTTTYRTPGNYLVEGDASAATYFLAAGAVRGTGVTVHGVGSDSVQGDVAFCDVLEAMGANVRREATSITVSPGRLRAIDADLNHIPDAAMTVAVLALFADGPTTIRNIYNWRVKETDRLHAMSTELHKLGAKVTQTEDSITVAPPGCLREAAIDTYGDHRMAMCFSLAALGTAAVTINDPECVAKTFPDYFEVLETLAA
ncbi:MAG: 3-phosphoshikimate 1-carboxyvinyltransferase [Pseudomonadales bacterium]|jgi:3-phosphoshikimate 1-carboxyvinyltransferase|nr:3-phosphoshikimate 1-carboxyvinyltransferase [Pseudomonadales bacterium]MDP6471830.1 3-phosphoshikimate 1-carboxyvinyltransferase [Pseudomonadales bacterium]MDP6828756.1 3-phosphoshikimate 1-carboxyvinyltransferase [Pseudomonadales bacterium]MDP6970311.1 3-phosphoshikimate 1-carboxyvinyltransferase [Pseudomonadales bacterium]